MNAFALSRSETLSELRSNKPETGSRSQYVMLAPIDLITVFVGSAVNEVEMT